MQTTRCGTWTERNGRETQWSGAKRSRARQSGMQWNSSVRSNKMELGRAGVRQGRGGVRRSWGKAQWENQSSASRKKRMGPCRAWQGERRQARRSTTNAAKTAEAACQAGRCDERSDMDRRRGTRQGARNGAGLGMARSGQHVGEARSGGRDGVRARWLRDGAGQLRSGAGRDDLVGLTQRNKTGGLQGRMGRGKINEMDQNINM